MQASLSNIWKETQRLSRKERMELVEKLIHQLKIEDEGNERLPTWEEMYGIGKGVWETDAQEYVKQLREERY